MFQLNNFVIAGKFFLIIAGELVLIFVAVSFLVGILMEYLPPSRIRDFLANKLTWVQYVLGAGLGAATPFCSCSTVPITAGLLKGGVPFGPTALGERLRVYHLARFYGTVGMLLRGGTPLVTAFGMVSGIMPEAMRSQLADATQRVREGANLSAAMEATGADHARCGAAAAGRREERRDGGDDGPDRGVSRRGARALDRPRHQAVRAAAHGGDRARHRRDRRAHVPADLRARG